MRLLLVEDTVALADQLLPLLRDHGYAVDWLADGRDALVRAHHDDFDLVILDLGLPGLDGLEVLRRWREQGLSMPVLILTARDSWAERVDGLRAGADDYLTNPSTRRSCCCGCRRCCGAATAAPTRAACAPAGWSWTKSARAPGWTSRRLN